MTKEVKVTTAYFKKHATELRKQGVKVGDTIEVTEVEEAPKAEKTKAAVEEEEVDEKDDTAEVSKDEPESVSVEVYYHNPSVGPTSRIFSKVDHGDKFRETAEQFKTKFKGSFEPPKKE